MLFRVSEAGKEKRRELTWRLATRERSTRTFPERSCCCHSRRNQLRFLNPRVSHSQSGSRRRSRDCKLSMLVRGWSLGMDSTNSKHQLKRHWVQGRMGYLHSRRDLLGWHRQSRTWRSIDIHMSRPIVMNQFWQTKKFRAISPDSSNFQASSPRLKQASALYMH